MTIPGPLAHSADNLTFDRNDNPKLDEAKEMLGLQDKHTSIAIARRLSILAAYDKSKFEDRDDEGFTMEARDDYHRFFMLCDALLDDGNPDISLQSMLTISQNLMTSGLADAIYPESQMTYRGRFFKRATELWHRGIIAAAKKTTPMVELVRSLGTDRNAIPESPILRLNEIAVSEEEANFKALIEAISAESMSFDEVRSRSAAFAFILSARLVEDPSRMTTLTKAFLGNVNMTSSMFRDKVNYWIPMGAINDAGNLIDEPAMYTKFVECIMNWPINYDSAFAVPAIFHLATHLQDEERIEELLRLSYDMPMLGAQFYKIIGHIQKHEWNFTVAEQAIAGKAAQVLKLQDGINL
jgi:hypothetical protein